MNRALRIASVVVCMLFGAGTQPSAFASSQTQTYELHMEQPQVSQAANGEMVSITGSGVFSVNPETVSATGTFTTQSSGNGTWVATQLLDFQPYGCDIFGTPIPQFAGVLWVFCLIGNPPPSAGEGAHLDIIGVNNFNKIVSGGNVFIKTS